MYVVIYKHEAQLVFLTSSVEWTAAFPSPTLVGPRPGGRGIRKGGPKGLYAFSAQVYMFFPFHSLSL